MATKKSTGERAAGKRPPAAAKAASLPKSMPKEGKDPKGGLTAKGREFFAKTEGAHLRPGVQGPADTPEKMVRKGSFLRRHFAHPRGPVKDEKGQPTRLALSAHAWGEPVPQTAADTKKLAAKGHELLEEYHQAKEDAERPKSAKKTAVKQRGTKTASARKVSAKKSAAKKSAAKKSAVKKSSVKGKVAKKAVSRMTGRKSVAR